jgi:hypothetical protein
MKQIGRRRWWIALAGVLIAYLLPAYVVLPALWSGHGHEPGRSGEGNFCYTDGEIDVAIPAVDAARQMQSPVTISPPPLIALKDQIWRGVSNAIGR